MHINFYDKEVSDRELPKIWMAVISVFSKKKIVYIIFVYSFLSSQRLFPTFLQKPPIFISGNIYKKKYHYHWKWIMDIQNFNYKAIKDDISINSRKLNWHYYQKGIDSQVCVRMWISTKAYIKQG